MDLTMRLCPEYRPWMFHHSFKLPEWLNLPSIFLCNSTMAKNVEIKARANAPVRQRELAARLADKDPIQIFQEDIFFNIPQGRLKLRILSEAIGVLIAYSRSDTKGPKTSDYYLSETSDPRSLATVLENSLGVRNTVIKTRILYMVGRTRVHLDNVASLGDFIELEVVLDEGEDEKAGEKEALYVMSQLEISQKDLVDCAYVDLLERQGQ